jgi:hypothetical protein
VNRTGPAVNRTEQDPGLRHRVSGLRSNSLAAIVMLLAEFGLGQGVSLYAGPPASDHGKGLLAAFGGAVTDGPVVLVLHALLGTLLLVTGVAAVARAVLVRRMPLIAAAGTALLAILVAWLSGARFAGHTNDGASLAMALATGLALLCYAVILFIAPRESRERAGKGRLPAVLPRLSPGAGARGRAGDYAPMALRAARASRGSSRWAAPALSRRWVSADVPGISRMFGDRCSSQASETCCAEAPSRAATSSSARAWTGERPRSGRNGTYATPSAAHRSSSGPSCRCARL